MQYFSWHWTMYLILCIYRCSQQTQTQPQWWRISCPPGHGSLSPALPSWVDRLTKITDWGVWMSYCITLDHFWSSQQIHKDTLPVNWIKNKQYVKCKTFECDNHFNNIIVELSSCQSPESVSYRYSFTFFFCQFMKSTVCNGNLKLIKLLWTFMNLISLYTFWKTAISDKHI